MRSVYAVSRALNVEPCIRMCTDDYVAREIVNDICGLSGAVIHNLIDGFIGVLCGCGLL